MYCVVEKCVLIIICLSRRRCFRLWWQYIYKDRDRKELLEEVEDELRKKELHYRPLWRHCGSLLKVDTIFSFYTECVCPCLSVSFAFAQVTPTVPALFGFRRIPKRKRTRIKPIMQLYSLFRFSVETLYILETIYLFKSILLLSSSWPKNLEPET